MPLTISHRQSEEIEILDLNGDLIFGAEDLVFRQAFDQILSMGKTRIVVNLMDLQDLDAIGLGTLTDSLSRVRKLGGNLAVFNPDPMHVQALLEAKLEETFEVLPTERDAINSFFPGRSVKHYDILEFVESLKQKDASVGSTNASKQA